MKPHLAGDIGRLAVFGTVVFGTVVFGTVVFGTVVRGLGREVPLDEPSGAPLPRIC